MVVRGVPVIARRPAVASRPLWKPLLGYLLSLVVAATFLATSFALSDALSLSEKGGGHPRASNLSGGHFSFFEIVARALLVTIWFSFWSCIFSCVLCILKHTKASP